MQIHFHRFVLRLVMVSVIFIGGSMNAIGFDMEKTDAAKSFLAGNYPLALEQFNQLRDQYPGSLDVRRYQALCLERMGRYEEAIEILLALLYVSPNPEATHFHLGKIYYRLRQGNLAEQHFESLASLGSESAYARLAQSYLDAISHQRSHSLVPGEPKKFNAISLIGFSTETKRDNSTNFSQTERARNRYYAYVSSSYYFLRNSNWTGLASASVYQSNREGNQTENDDLTRWSVKTSIQRQLRFGEKLGTALLGIRYYETALDGNKYSRGLATDGELRFRFFKDSTTRLYYSRGEDSFSDFDGLGEGFLLPSLRRDTWGIDQAFQFNDREIEVGVGLFTKSVETTEGVPNREETGLRLYGDFSLPREFKFRVTLESVDSEYFRAGTASRTSDSMSYGLSLSRAISDRLSLRLSYGEVHSGIVRNGGDGKNATFGVSLSYTY